MTALVGSERPHRVADLNDAFRRDFSGGRTVLTAGVAALSEARRTALLAAVGGFERFSPDNDPTASTTSARSR